MKLYSYFRSESGSVMPVIGLLVAAMLGSAGAAVDTGRGELVKIKLVSSMDAAGLAAGASLSTESLQGEALKYLNVNFNNYLGATITDFVVTPNADNTLITLDATAIVPTTFMQIFGIDTITVRAHSEITRQSSGLELVMVLDNTGSMAGTKLASLKTAATDMLNILYGGKNTVTNLWVGLVPFGQAVNIGTNNSAWLDSTYTATLDFGPIANVSGKTCSPYNSTNGVYTTGPVCAYTLSPLGAVPTFGSINWQGCVEARGNSTLTPQYDLTDDPPSVKPFKPYLYTNGLNQNSWKYGSSVNCTGGGCLQSHTVASTCTTTYPACCAANDESCTNPFNCGKPSVTNPCQKTVCDVQGPAQVCTGTKTYYDYSPSTWLGVNRGPNAYCPQPVQPMVAEKNTIIAALNNMQAVGETEIPLGLSWGWRLLSPRWQGLWGGEMNTNNLPLPYNKPLMTKAVILMTDGDNNIVTGTYSAYGTTNTAAQLGVVQCTSGSCTAGINKLNDRTTTVCNNMKNNNIIIYTVALGSSINDNSKTLLQNCATSAAFFFISPTEADLETVFKKIADSLSKLMVSR